MNPTSRAEQLRRLENTKLDIADQCFLHHKSLFSDLRKASVHARGRLLDVGCGNKPYEEFFRNSVSEHVGCDVVQSSENRVDFICPATELPFEAASFDTVLITQVIEHVAEHQILVSEAFRVLKSNGVLILSGPMYWPLHEEPYDFFRFTKHGLRFLLEKAGFAGIEIENNGGKWALCGQVLIHTLRNTRLHRGFVIRVINRIFSHLEDRQKTSDNTMNYVVVAKKP